MASLASWDCEGCRHIVMADRGIGPAMYCEKYWPEGSRPRTEWVSENEVACLDYDGGGMEEVGL